MQNEIIERINNERIERHSDGNLMPTSDEEDDDENSVDDKESLSGGK
jgi:hypothetical protein